MRESTLHSNSIRWRENDLCNREKRPSFWTDINFGCHSGRYIYKFLPVAQMLRYRPGFTRPKNWIDLNIFSFQRPFHKLALTVIIKTGRKKGWLRRWRDIDKLLWKKGRHKNRKGSLFLLAIWLCSCLHRGHSSPLKAAENSFVCRELRRWREKMRPERGSRGCHVITGDTKRRKLTHWTRSNMEWKVSLLFA